MSGTDALEWDSVGDFFLHITIILITFIFITFT
jgi:hypothetical protein